MQSTKSMIVCASLGALMALGASGPLGAQESSDGKAPVKKSHKVKSAAKAQTSSTDMAGQLQALRDQVDALQRRLDAQNAADAQTKATADRAAGQAAAASAQAATATAATTAIPEQVKTAVDAAKPKSDKLYVKGVSVTLGGFAAFESVYRNHNETADIGSSYSGLPLPNSSVGNTSEQRFTARQSRVSALAEGDPTADTHLAFYGEFDFLGAAQTANSNESNSYNLRIRHIYSTIDRNDWALHLLAGQNWSLVTLNSKGITPRNEVIPAVIDAQYVPGFNWARQPQIRLTKDFDKTLWLALSLENAQTTFYTGANALPSTVKLTYNAPAGSLFNSANTLSLNRVPDVVAKIAYEPTFADRTVHVEAYGLYRNFYERLSLVNQSSNGGGFGAGLVVPLVPKVLDFQVSGLGGKGIGRYGSGQLPDVTFDAAGNIRPISEIQALAGLTLHAGSQLDIYAYAGEEKETAQPYNLTSGTTVTGYGLGNPLYSNAGCQYEGAKGSCVGNTRVLEQATLGFWHKPYVGPFGRYQWGLQYSRTERKTFAGAGGIAPIGTDSMVFASFRYYPF